MEAIIYRDSRGGLQRVWKEEGRKSDKEGAEMKFRQGYRWPSTKRWKERRRRFLFFSLFLVFGRDLRGSTSKRASR